MNPYGLILGAFLFALLVIWGLLKITDKCEERDDE